MGRTCPTKGGPLEIAVQRVDQWRRSRTRGRMPMWLWRLAAEAASIAGVEITATRLRLDVERLRDRMRSWDLGEDRLPSPSPFVELRPWSPGPAGAECLVEVESPTGRKLRISLKGTATTQTLALSELLWRSPS